MRFLILFILFFTYTALLAQPPRYIPVTPEGGKQYAFEMELSGVSIRTNFLRNFSLPDVHIVHHVVTKIMTAEEKDNYLNPNTFDHLPEDIQRELSQGEDQTVSIKLENTPTAPIQTKNPPGLAVPHSGPVVPQSLTPNFSSPSLILPHQNVEGHKLENGLLLPQNFQRQIPESQRLERRWKTIFSRWKALPVETKDKLILPSQLHPFVLERVLMTAEMEYKGERKILDLSQYLKLKEDIPEKVKTLLRSFRWNVEGNNFEVRHSSTVKSKEALLKDLKQLAELIGIGRYIDDPNTNFPLVVMGQNPNNPQEQYPRVDMRFSYHFHVSRFGESVTPWAKSLNKLRALELDEVGRAGSIVDEHDYGYKSDEYLKGLIRVVQKNHLELRIHAASPREELDQIDHFLSLPPAEALKEIDGLIASQIKRITKKVLAEALKGEKGDFIHEEILLQKLGLVLDKETTQSTLKGLDPETRKKVVSSLMQYEGWRILLPHLEPQEREAHFKSIVKNRPELQTRIPLHLLRHGVEGADVLDLLKPYYRQMDIADLGKILIPNNILEYEVKNGSALALEIADMILEDGDYNRSMGYHYPQEMQNLIKARWAYPKSPALTFKLTQLDTFVRSLLQCEKDYGILGSIENSWR